MIGEFQATLDLGGGPLTSGGSIDLFIAKLAFVRALVRRFGSVIDVPA